MNTKNGLKWAKHHNRHLLAAQSSSRSLVVRPSVRLYTLTVVTVVIIVTEVKKKLFLCQTFFIKIFITKKTLKNQQKAFFTNKLVSPINCFFHKKYVSPNSFFTNQTISIKYSLEQKKLFSPNKKISKKIVAPKPCYTNFFHQKHSSQIH